jgi:hypothetical protein
MKRINNIDDFLGASGTRYFSHGFRLMGAIEYVAIACNVCEQLITMEYHLTDEEVALSWIRSCHLK